MGFRQTIFEARETVLRLINPNVNSAPFDPERYHRAFVAGLVGLSASITGTVILIVAGKPLEAVAALASGFFIPFSIQLAAEYNVKPKE